jgi:Synergist-CTERM protein sorting domain-containing protein
MRHLFAAFAAAAICTVTATAFADAPAPFCGTGQTIGTACTNCGDNCKGTCQDSGVPVDGGGPLYCVSSGGGCSSGGSLFGPWLLALVVPIALLRRRRR